MTLNGAALSVDYFIDEQMIATKNDFEQKISVCDFVAFPGYPEWHDKATHRPIFRTGTIASDPRVDYSYKNVKGQCVAFEAFSFGGSSGSPVFSLQKGLQPGAGISIPGFRPAMFIGINAGHLVTKLHTHSDLMGHSGISYFFKAPAIVDTILG